MNGRRRCRAGRNSGDLHARRRGSAGRRSSCAVGLKAPPLNIRVQAPPPSSCRAERRARGLRRHHGRPAGCRPAVADRRDAADRGEKRGDMDSLSDVREAVMGAQSRRTAPGSAPEDARASYVAPSPSDDRTASPHEWSLPGCGWRAPATSCSNLRPRRHSDLLQVRHLETTCCVGAGLNAEPAVAPTGWASLRAEWSRTIPDVQQRCNPEGGAGESECLSSHAEAGWPDDRAGCRGGSHAGHDIGRVPRRMTNPTTG